MPRPLLPSPQNPPLRSDFEASLSPIDFGIERKTVDASTGARKSTKSARFDLCSPFGQIEEAKVGGMGAEKYEDHNWRAGYGWSKSYAAAQRHMVAWWSGEDLDPESGLSHLAHARWHMSALIEFQTLGTGHDDRFPVVVQREVSGFAR